MPVFHRNQGEVAHEDARGRQLEEEAEARLAQARSRTRRSVQDVQEPSLLREQLDTARRAATSAVRLSTLAWISARSGGLDPSLAADRQDDAYRARLRAVRTEDTDAEVQVALFIRSGALVR